MDEQVKDPTTIDEQIHILSERGMQVDADLARQWLRSVSYYRLSGYWYPYREQLESAPRMPVRADTFVQGSTFTEVAGLYEFDRKLRTLVHWACAQVVDGLFMRPLSRPLGVARIRWGICRRGWCGCGGGCRSLRSRW